MSIQAVNWAIEQRVGDPTLKILLLAICNYTNENDECWPSQAVLARDSEVSDRTIRRALKKLVDLGFIETQSRERAGGGNSSLLIRILRHADKLSDTPADTHMSAPPRTPVVRTPPDIAVSAPYEPSIEPSIEPSMNVDLFAGDRSSAATVWPKDFREQFWSRYPVKKGKTGALAKLDAIRRAGKVPWDAVVAGLDNLDRAIASGRQDVRYVKHPSTWLNQGCWDDEFGLPPGSPPAGSGSRGRVSFGDIIRDGMDRLS